MLFFNDDLLSQVQEHKIILISNNYKGSFMIFLMVT